MCKAKNLVGEAVTTCVVSVDCKYFITIFSLLHILIIGWVLLLKLTFIIIRLITLYYIIQYLLLTTYRYKEKKTIESFLFNSSVKCYLNHLTFYKLFSN